MNSFLAFYYCSTIYINNVMLNRLQNTWDKDEIFREIQAYSLLVVDDFGIERDTSYGFEQIYNIVNTRTLSDRPTIFTTNLSLAELQTPKDMEHKRSYSRVLEMCPMRLRLEKQDRRTANAQEKRAQALNIFGYGTEG